MLDPEHGLPPEYRSVLRTKLGMGPEAAPIPPPETGTNAAPRNVAGQVPKSESVRALGQSRRRHADSGVSRPLLAFLAWTWSWSS